MRFSGFLNNISALLQDPRSAGLMVAAVSALLLGGAWYFEFFKNLEPCILCLYQRVPHALTLVLGILAAAVACKFNRPKVGASFLFLAGLVFLVGSGLAAYHVGVEQHFWVSAFEACVAPEVTGSPDNLLEQIQKAKAVRCDTIPWSLFGISMAGYNALISMGMAAFSIAAAIMSVRRANGF